MILTCSYQDATFNYWILLDKVIRNLKNITIIHTFNLGEFGVVYRGRLSGWKGRVTAELVAVKTLKGEIVVLTSPYQLSLIFVFS